MQLIVSTESLFKSVAMEHVMADIEKLKARKPDIVCLSPHDSNDEAIEKFREAFDSLSGITGW